MTTSIRIWKAPRVKVGRRYALENGYIVVDAVQEIGWDGITSDLAQESGFSGVVDLLKTAKHGDGTRVYLVEFHFMEEV